MNSFFKTIIAGYGAKKLGGGCLSTIIIFVLIYFALGQCNRADAQVNHRNLPVKAVSDMSMECKTE
ncbi:hypothetical protein [Pedobacter arcticus]|uniref:hypothetical protein n=1 Tax=Pedobacter arcticus TaxID=752140 RepID=UPI0002DFE6FA|nr:hypothetical protein [Pedobacter arcticus]